MGNASIMSARTVGIQAHAVSIEVSISEEHRGPMSVAINAPEHVTTELRVKVESAIQNSGFPYPEKRVYVKINGDVGRDTRAYDLPIALAVLAAQGTIPAGALAKVSAVGELALDGRIRGVRGVLPMVAGLDDHTLTFLVPRENYAEAREMEGTVEMFPVHTLVDAVTFLQCDAKTQAQALWVWASKTQPSNDPAPDVDFCDVRGQKHAVRAAEIAVAGGHSLLFEGVPGSGKTMIARRMPTIMPRATFDEKIEAMSIASVAGVLNVEGWRRPFRAPHHSASEVAILGGGPHGRPGEVSLAHNGVLFLDEAPEFKGLAVDAVATAARTGEVRLRDGAFPAAPLTVGASNPCPCGYHGHPRAACVCHPTAIGQYRKRAHRFPWQMVAQMPAMTVSELKNGEKNESSELIRARVVKARERQKARGVLNAKIELVDMNVDNFALSTDAQEWAARREWTTPDWLNTLRIARTIADLANGGLVCAAHLEEAATYLPKKGE